MGSQAVVFIGTSEVVRFGPDYCEDDAFLYIISSINASLINQQQHTVARKIKSFDRSGVTVVPLKKCSVV